MVVLGHSIIIYSSQWSIYTTTNESSILSLLKQVINIFQMPLFFSLSGFLFYYSERKYGWLQIIKGKLLRLGIPFLCFSFLWLFPIRMFVQYPGYKEISLVNIVISKILLGYDNGHMWYLPTLFICFVYSVVFSRLFKKVIKRELYFQLLNCSISGALYLIRFIVPVRAYIDSFVSYYLWFACGIFLAFLYNNYLELILRFAKYRFLLLVITVLFVLVNILYNNFVTKT